MRIVFLFMILCIYSSAQETQGKIDMHGGGEQSLYEKSDKKKNDFSSIGFGAAALRDANATQKRNKPTQK